MERSFCPYIVTADILFPPQRSAEAVLVCFVGDFAIAVHGSGSRRLWQRSCGVIDEPFEVLNGGGQQEFVLGAAQAAQSQPDQRMNVLCLAEQSFDLLTLAS